MKKPETLECEWILTVRGLSKHFGGVQAVSELSFEIAKGEIVGLIGANGAGKTTVISLLGGLIKPDRGQIFFRGSDITNESQFKICKAGVVRTYQICRPFPNMSLFENILIGTLNQRRDLSEAKRATHEIVNLCGLTDWAEMRAGDVSTVILKRLELAKALATGPALILLDEVLAGLTPVEVESSLKLIRKINETGLTILISEHNMTAIMKLSERIIAMHQGTKIAEGTPEEIISNERVIEAYLGRHYIETEISNVGSKEP